MGIIMDLCLALGPPTISLETLRISSVSARPLQLRRPRLRRRRVIHFFGAAKHGEPHGVSLGLRPFTTYKWSYIAVNVVILP